MSSNIRIGVFVPNDAQMLDLATVDVLGVMSKEYFTAVSALIPAHVGAIAPSVTVFYITTPSAGSHIPLTSGAVLKATNSYKDDEVAPGKLDIVVVPGPDPTGEYEEGGLEWLRRQSETEGVDVLSVCTGIYICAAAGIVDGRMASGPRGMQDDLLGKFPNIKLVGDNQRWARDGNFWSSGGVTNGNDLMAAYARACGRWPQPVVEIGLALTDVGDRGQLYGESTRGFMLGMVWNLVKAWFLSLGAPKQKTG